MTMIVVLQATVLLYSYHGGWWYRCCHYSNLNGVYNDTTYARGVNWATWTGYLYSLKFTEMKIKLKD